MIAIISQQQKEILIGKTFDGVCYFNPVTDRLGNWVISEIEYYYCLGLWYLDELNPGLEFVTTLSLEYYDQVVISKNPFSE